MPTATATALNVYNPPPPPIEDMEHGEPLLSITTEGALIRRYVRLAGGASKKRFRRTHEIAMDLELLPSIPLENLETFRVHGR